MHLSLLGVSVHLIASELTAGRIDVRSKLSSDSGRKASFHKLPRKILHASSLTLPETRTFNGVDRYQVYMAQQPSQS